MTVFEVSRALKVVIILEMLNDLSFFVSLPADSAGKEIIGSMSIQVLLLVRDLIESELTVLDGAEEGTLACVDPQMIK